MFLIFCFENLIRLPSFSHNTRIVVVILEIVFLVQVWIFACKQPLCLILSSIFLGLEILLLKGISITHSMWPRGAWWVTQIEGRASRS